MMEVKTQQRQLRICDIIYRQFCLLNGRLNFETAIFAKSLYLITHVIIMQNFTCDKSQNSQIASSLANLLGHKQNCLQMISQSRHCCTGE
jgi:hypothetical protein